MKPTIQNQPINSPLQGIKPTIPKIRFYLQIIRHLKKKQKWQYLCEEIQKTFIRYISKKTKFNPLLNLLQSRYTQIQNYFRMHLFQIQGWISAFKDVCNIDKYREQTKSIVRDLLIQAMKATQPDQGIPFIAYSTKIYTFKSDSSLDTKFRKLQKIIINNSTIKQYDRFADQWTKKRQKNLTKQIKRSLKQSKHKQQQHIMVNLKNDCPEPCQQKQKIHHQICDKDYNQQKHQIKDNKQQNMFEEGIFANRNIDSQEDILWIMQRADKLQQQLRQQQAQRQANEKLIKKQAQIKIDKQIINIKTDFNTNAINTNQQSLKNSYHHQQSKEDEEYSYDLNHKRIHKTIYNSRKLITQQRKLLVQKQEEYNYCKPRKMNKLENNNIYHHKQLELLCPIFEVQDRLKLNIDDQQLYS